jgi:hypothetical protein
MGKADTIGWKWLVVCEDSHPRIAEAEPDGMREIASPSLQLIQAFDNNKWTWRALNGGRYRSKVVAQGDAEKERKKIWLRNYL